MIQRDKSEKSLPFTTISRSPRDPASLDPFPDSLSLHGPIARRSICSIYGTVQYVGGTIGIALEPGVRARILATDGETGYRISCGLIL